MARREFVMDQAPVRRHTEISAGSAAQLELRLHWFTRALAMRQGYIITVLRRLKGSGRHVATVAYELPLPRFARPRRVPPARRASLRSAAQRGTPEHWVLRHQGSSSSPV
jgi:hypothetical protein